MPVISAVLVIIAPYRKIDAEPNGTAWQFYRGEALPQMASTAVAEGFSSNAPGVFGRRLRNWLAQDDEVLLRVAERAARHVLNQFPAVREAIAHERGRVEGRAKVRTCELGPA